MILEKNQMHAEIVSKKIIHCISYSICSVVAIICTCSNVTLFTGVRNLLEVAGTIPEHRSLKVSANSRLHASLALNKVWEDLMSEKEQTIYKESVNEFFT